MSLSRIADRTAVRVAVFALIATVLVWGMLPYAGFTNEFRDAQVMTLYERTAVDTVRRFGELPLWNPWYCGGLDGLGAPQSRFASPTFLLSLLFGAERAEPILIFLFAIVGMEGTFRWIRLRVNDASAALRVAPLFALSGHFAVAYFRGWTSFFGFELVPLILFGITAAARGVRGGIAVAAIAFGVMLGFGGTFAAPLVAVAATVEAVRAIAETPPSRRLVAILTLAAVASFMAAVAAVRLLPIAETLIASPRLMAGTPGHAPKSLLFFLVKTLEARGGDVQDPGMFFVGVGFLALVALGGSDRRSAAPLLIVIMFLWLAAGYARKPPLFALLRELPIFSALRYPERFLWLAILYACEPAARALARVPLLGEGRRWRVGTTVLLTGACLASLTQQLLIFADVGKARDLSVVATLGDRDANSFHQARGNRWLAAHWEGVGAGSLSCWETHPVIMSPKLRGDLAREEYFADPSLGTVERVSWSPNVIVLKVAAKTATRLFINQNWHPGWRASRGVVTSDEGLLAVDVPAGSYELRLSFAPRSALAGAAVSAVALLALLILGTRAPASFRRGKIMKTSLLVAAPWVVLGAFAATDREPRFPPPPQRNANGTPALVSEVAPDAIKLSAQFDIPIVVDAIRFESPNVNQNIKLDLWLRRTGPIPRTTGMFVRVIRRDPDTGEPMDEALRDRDKDKRDTFGADHQVVGGSFYLSDAPENILIHDAFGLQVGKGARGQYDVWLGFGHVSGRRGFAKLASHPDLAVHDDLVRVASFFLR